MWREAGHVTRNVNLICESVAAEAKTSMGVQTSHRDTALSSAPLLLSQPSLTFHLELFISVPLLKSLTARSEDDTSFYYFLPIASVALFLCWMGSLAFRDGKKNQLCLSRPKASSSLAEFLPEYVSSRNITVIWFHVFPLGGGQLSTRKPHFISPEEGRVLFRLHIFPVSRK